jgi:uncharacterized protein (DUF433 family)
MRRADTSTRPMDLLRRITRDPSVMGGRPCIRGLRVTVGTIVGLLAAGRTHDDVLPAYPYWEAEDILAALSYAAWRTEDTNCVSVDHLLVTGVSPASEFLEDLRG